MFEAPLVSSRELARWCREHLGALPAEELHREGHLSTVVALRLDDGRKVVVKVRAPSARLDACVEVQRAVAAAGFPCPRPLTGVVELGGFAATAETYIGGGDVLPSSGRAAAPFAAALARLVGLVPRPADVGTLVPPPAWTGWNHDEPGLWPMPDDHDRDLNTVAGPEWIDRVGYDARERLRAHGGSPVLGHGDWYTGNLRWRGGQLVVAHDWDSVITDTEAAVAGFAAAVYPAVDAGGEASIAESDDFIRAYSDACQRPFSSDDIECAWAAGVWLRAFDARKQSAKHQPVASLTEDEANERLRRAGSR